MVFSAIVNTAAPMDIQAKRVRNLRSLVFGFVMMIGIVAEARQEGR